MRYTDTTINNTMGYGDTNVNVFEFGFLPLNDVFDYGGVKAFFDRSVDSAASFVDNIVTGSHSFSRRDVASATTFSDRNASASTNFSKQTTDE